LESSTNIGATYDEDSTWKGAVDEVKISKVARSSNWDKTEYANQNSPSTFLVEVSNPPGGVPVTGYNYFKSFEIQNSYVYGTSNFVDFPVLFSDVLEDIRTLPNGGYVEDENGYDIIFTDESNTILDHEVERYTSTTGGIISWIKIPILSYSSNTTIRMHYGNSSISSSQENITDVWDSDYIGVYHLNESFLDSTSNDNDATNNETLNIDGKISKGRDFPLGYVHQDLDPDLVYYYILTSENVYGEGDESSEYNSSPYPTFPENVVAAPGIEKITLTWDAALGADSYNIYWDTSSGVTTLDNKITGVTSPYLHTSLGDYTYYYIVTSVSGITESSPSSEVSADPWYGPPTGPTNFEIDTDTLLDSECVLQWDSMDWTDSYNLYYLSQEELDALSGVKKTTVSYETVMTYGTEVINITSPYDHYPLTAQNYYYCIVGVNAIGEGVPEGVLIVKIKYDGKVFDHASVMFTRLAQQYRLD
jgi:hypothetical protein